jgi:spoIIIJ-associated protein
MVAAKQEEYKRVIVEVGGYREERESYLQDLANRLKEEVVSTGSEKTIRGLKPWERRLIHMMLVEDGQVETESSGEDRDRVLVIRKK